MSKALLEFVAVGKTFAGGGTFLARRGRTRAVDGISLRLRRGGALGLVGESGSGKSTLARLATGLLTPSEGAVRYGGEDIRTLGGRDRRALHRRLQMVFQDPASSLNPRRTVRQAQAAPLRHIRHLPADQRRSRTFELMEMVGLSTDLLERYPHELSGGQAQRVAIARALAADPELLVLDEPTSALDVTVQSQVLRLLVDLRRQLDLTYLFISHDLALVEAVADEIAVMRQGRIVEHGERNQVLSHPRHRYTRLLLAAIPDPEAAIRR